MRTALGKCRTESTRSTMQHPEATGCSTNRNRIITRATMYGVGFTNVFDTYLSPQEYKGIDFRISRESMRMTRLIGRQRVSANFLPGRLGIYTQQSRQ